MRLLRTRLLRIAALCLCLALANALLSNGAGASANILSVNESASRIHFRLQTAEVSLVVRNLSRRNVRATINLQLQDPPGDVQAEIRTEKEIPPGETTITSFLEPRFRPLDQRDLEQALWWRLRYSVVPEEAAGGLAKAATGIVSLSTICSDFFELAVLAPTVTDPGKYAARVRATNPIDGKPVEGVELRAHAVFDDDAATGEASARTDENGSAVIELDIPKQPEAARGRFELNGVHNGLTQEVDSELFCDVEPRVILTTDKPLYQPDQTLHIRALVQDPKGRAIPDAKIILKVEDPEETLMYRAEPITTRFGVAAADWPIPGNTRLGDYRVIAQTEGSEDRYNAPGQCKVRISRYDLPTFTVSVEPDRKYYLADQNAKVEVRADYLFGKPLSAGHVRVVRETSRSWDYREQKWEIDEQTPYEGELDKDGKFTASIDLRNEYISFRARKYDRYEDLSYAAYVTDESTGRTEQRRFDLRLSSDPIHVYVIDDYSTWPDFYVSTFYADGEPAQCRVSVTDDSRIRRMIRTVRTNRYGLAKVSRLARFPLMQDLELRLTARDSRNNVSHQTYELRANEDPMVRITTSKALYRPGEPLDVFIESYPPIDRVFVDVARGWTLLRSEEVKLKNGKAHLVLPYNRDFRDSITVAGFTMSGNYQLWSARRTVLYPRDHQLKVEVVGSRSEYKPGEEAVVDFQVRKSTGQATESVLGVSVIDRAVDERSRTDTDFGTRSGWWSVYDRMWGRNQSIAGITRGSLDKIDTSRPIPRDLDLVAEVLLLRGGYLVQRNEASYARSLGGLFYVALRKQLQPVGAALQSRYSRTGEYPRGSAALIREMNEAGIGFGDMVDPWGTRYYSNFSFNRRDDVLKILSAGPDKRPRTADDFVALTLSWRYFKPVGEKIDRAVADHHRRTGGYIRTAAVLEREVRRLGVELSALRDRWGRGYRLSFSVSGTEYRIELASGGEDKRFERANSSPSDDFTIWTSSIDYTTELKGRITSAVGLYYAASGRMPGSEQELSDALRNAGVNEDELRDPWGHRFYAVFTSDHRFGDNVRIYTETKFGRAPHSKTEITPVTRELRFVHLRSAGPDGVEGTYDDFEVAAVSRVVKETPPPELVKPSLTPPPLTASTGGIAGLVTDPSGAVIVNAKITAQGGADVATAKSGADGTYQLTNLHPGLYEVRFEAAAFKTTLVVDVPVRESAVTKVDATLWPGGTSETVNVTAEATKVETEQATISSSQVSELPLDATKNPLVVGVGKDTRMISTPRLREYFPETLVWQPSLETDSDGLAHLRFKLADNITTWRLSAVASTEDGEVGEVERSILAFQPFFVEHDPPRVLTQGDRVMLPVVLRNYINKPQAVELEMISAAWFKLNVPARRHLDVPPGDSIKALFDFEAVSAIEKGKQQVTASAPEVSDAIEKPVTVHPDGEEITRTTTRIIGDDALIEADMPTTALAGTARGELKIYPNLMAHVLESIGAIMERPYGCAEQTISAAYPSLLMLKRRDANSVPSAIRSKAERYLRLGYDRLVNDRDASGGFSYWGRGAADAALTAYAVRFLNDARGALPIDEDVIDSASEWLIKQQQGDGRWPVFDWNNNEDRRRTELVTSYIARVLAAVDKNETSVEAKEPGPLSKAVRLALRYLSGRVHTIDEPYLIASYALAAASAGDSTGAKSATEKLRSLAHEEAGAYYWALETNTPFYGWGLAGRVETTAIALQALAAEHAGDDSTLLDDKLINGGLVFLLRNKDRYGVWYSTQATINVLDALITVNDKSAPNATADNNAALTINGRPGPSIAMPPSSKLTGPITVDLSESLSAGVNRVEIRRAHDSPRASARVVITHWEGWAAPNAAPSPASLRVNVDFDKTEARTGEDVVCTVEAERVGFHGYGMLLAEIGLPPGADVDRASLERAMTESYYALQQYDILPDRVIFYLWPKAGGIQFNFKFRPRFAMTAKTSPSLLYDYYNPEARVVVPPTLFKIK
jgi:hypothetical protein